MQEQLNAVDAAVNLCPPRLKLGLEEVQQRVVERWEELRDYTERRGEELKLAYQRYLFMNTVKTPLLSSFVLHYVTISCNNLVRRSFFICIYHCLLLLLC